jgi:hypothetical protein
MVFETKRILVPVNDPELEPIQTALGIVGVLAERDSVIKEVLIVVHTKANLSGTTLETTLGKGVAKALAEGKSVRLFENLVLRAETLKTINQHRAPHIIIGVYADKKMLDAIDALPRSIAVIIVPWIMDDEVQEWRRTWSPVVIGEKAPEIDLIIDNPIVEEAMKMLSGSVNLSTGLSHPLDRAKAIDLFRGLKDNREPFEPDAIRAWAVRNNWRPKAADELRSIAQGVLEGKRFKRGGIPSWNPQMIEILRQKVQQSKYSEEQ